MQEVTFVNFYKLNTVWLTKLTQVARSKPGGNMVIFDYEFNYLVVKKSNIKGTELAEVPVYENPTSGEMYYEGTEKWMFTVRDIGKTYVTERIKVPEKFFSEEEIRTNRISEERLCFLYRELIFSKTLENIAKESQ